MIDFASIANNAIALLRQGAVQEADDLLVSSLREHTKQQAEAAGIKPPPPAPRAPNAVLLDVLNVILGLFGVPPKLEALIKELEQVL